VQQDLLDATDRRAGVLTLNRPDLGNRLTHAMRLSLLAALQRHEKNRDIYAVILEAGGAPQPFCLGDEPLSPGPDDLRAQLTTAATCPLRIDRFAKPFVSLIGGAAAGGGLGLAVYGTHRVASEAATFSVGDGLGGGLALGGLADLLRRLPGHLGLYLALSERPMDRALAYQTGLVTHCINSRHFPEIRERLALADPIDDILDGLHADPGTSPLSGVLETIDACFGAGAPEDILTSLEAVQGPRAAWSIDLANSIGQRSARRVDMVHDMLALPPDANLRGALAREFRVAIPQKSGPGSLLAEPEGGDLILPPEPQVPSIS
jgi:enoyl-CoA hydratase